MKSLSATEVARRFSDVLDAVETEGETFLVVRRGRTIARIEPAAGAQGRAVKALLKSAPHDKGWIEDVKLSRASTQLEERRWPG